MKKLEVFYVYFLFSFGVYNISKVSRPNFFFKCLGLCNYSLEKFKPFLPSILIYTFPFLRRLKKISWIGCVNRDLNLVYGRSLKSLGCLLKRH